MGQYHKLYNVTRKEFVHPHKIGNGLKLTEQCGFPGSTASALFRAPEPLDPASHAALRIAPLRESLVHDQRRPPPHHGAEGREAFGGQGKGDQGEHGAYGAEKECGTHLR